MALLKIKYKNELIENISECYRNDSENVENKREIPENHVIIGLYG